MKEVLEQNYINDVDPSVGTWTFTSYSARTSEQRVNGVTGESYLHYQGMDFGEQFYGSRATLSCNYGYVSSLEGMPERFPTCWGSDKLSAEDV